jgi:RNA polymerase sigma-70 factor (ECF subfamily)
VTFEDLYRIHMPDVRRFALYLTGDAAESDDIASETFVQAWVADAPLRARSLRAYLLSIARNLHRQRRRRQRRFVFWSAAAEATADPAPAADRALAARDELDRTMRDLQALPEASRAALLMRAFHGLAYDEIGEALGISEGAAKVKVHRARKMLEARRDMT